MSKSFKYTVVVSFMSLISIAQVDLGGFMNKANALRGKVNEKTKENSKEEDSRTKDYDESNFNYAISFLDNSGAFETKEKWNVYANYFLSGSKPINSEEKSLEARAYNNLKNGELLMANNKYYLAEQSLKLAKLLYETDSKTTDANYAQVISDLGLLYQSRGHYNKAAKFNEKAIKLREAGSNKGMLIVSINNDAVLKKETGYYVEAETGFKKAMSMAVSEGDGLAEALIHNNLAMTYLDMNKLKEAESEMDLCISAASKEKPKNKLNLQTLIGNNKVLKENSSNFIKLQINLANIYRIQKKYPKAEELYLKAIAIKQEKLGEHPDLAHLKRGLAQLYMEMGKSEEVEKLLMSALEIDKKKLGKNNPATLSVQQELANFYRFTNNTEKSLDLISAVVAKKKEIYGENHPNYVQALEDMALTQWLANKPNECKANYKLVIDNTLTYINTFFNALNDNEKALYWEKTNARLQHYYSFARTQAKTDNETLKQFYNTVINTKGFLLSNSSKIRNTIFSSGDESLKATYDQWLETKEQLNQAYQLSKEELEQEKINLDSLKLSANDLEREISKKSALFKKNLEEKPLTFESLQKQLKPNECAVEIVNLSEYNNGFTGKDYYVALVLSNADIKMVELGEGKEIEKAILDFRDKTTHLKPENSAYAATWKPLDELLNASTKIYLSLDGAYHQLSINALKDGAGKYLADRYLIQFLGNTKDMVEVKHSEAASIKPTTAFLIGNPLYGSKGVLPQLPGTETEVKNISKLLTNLKVSTTSVYGADATEAKVKALVSPGIVHIATHGYFLADIGKLETTKVLGVDISAASENPLLRSGVLLAACENVFDEGYRPSPNSENGVLTAYEAMSLNLDKTDLVVLSACETGLGSVKQGEGVYGLQRAFLIAGAKSIIMSLWDVSDDATMELMTLFYSNYAKTGNKSLAFSDAIKQLKIKYKEPYYWSAFVMLNK